MTSWRPPQLERERVGLKARAHYSLVSKERALSGSFQQRQSREGVYEIRDAKRRKATESMGRGEWVVC